MQDEPTNMARRTQLPRPITAQIRASVCERVLAQTRLRSVPFVSIRSSIAFMFRVPCPRSLQYESTDHARRKGRFACSISCNQTSKSRHTFWGPVQETHALTYVELRLPSLHRHQPEANRSMCRVARIAPRFNSAFRIHVAAAETVGTSSSTRAIRSD